MEKLQEHNFNILQLMMEEEEVGFGLVIYETEGDRVNFWKKLPKSHNILIPGCAQYSLVPELKAVPEDCKNVNLYGFSIYNPQFSSLNFKRDSWYNFNFLQIWWMSKEYYLQAVVSMPDLISYFIPKLNLCNSLI